MNKIIKKIKLINRKRNLMTTRLKIKLRMVVRDDYKKKKSVLKPEKTKSVVIFMYASGVGDAIIMTGLIKHLNDLGIKIYVIAEPRTSHVFENSPHVNKTYTVISNNNNESIYNEIKEQNFDVLIDVDDISHHSPLKLEIIKKLNINHVIGVNQFSRLFDTSLKINLNGLHITSKHIAVAKLFNLNIDELHYHLSINENSIHTATDFISRYQNKKVIVINPYGTEESRDMSLKQISDICQWCNKHYNSNPFIIGIQDKINKIPDSDHHIVFTPPDFQDAAAIIKIADIVISTDTSIVHLCNALNKKLVCIYNNKIFYTGENNNILYAPNYKRAIQVLSPGKRVDDTPLSLIVEKIKTLIEN